MPSNMAEAVIEVPLEHVPLTESATDLRLELVEISTANGPAELGPCLKHVTHIINDIPLPIFEFKNDSSKIRQSDGRLKIPISRSNHVGGTEALIGWKVANASTESPLLSVKGLVNFDSNEFEKSIEFGLPDTPNLVKEEIIEIEIQSGIESKFDFI